MWLWKQNEATTRSALLFTIILFGLSKRMDWERWKIHVRPEDTIDG